MKQILLLVFVFFFTGLQAQTDTKEIGLNGIIGGKFRARGIQPVQPLPDGEHYSGLSEDQSAIVKYAYKTGKAVDTLFNIHTARECTIEKIDGYIVSSTGFRIIIWTDQEPVYRRSWKANLFDYDTRRNLVKPLSDSPGKLMLPTFSPDGRLCAFVRDNNIWLKKFDYDTESQVTKDGAADKILNGQGDWVYEEEFKATNLMSWSSDSKMLAFVKFDESKVPTFSFQVFDGSLYPDYIQFKYPKAGEKNSTVSVHTYNIDSKDIKKMDLPIAAEDYIPLIRFTESPDQLAIMTLNRQQNLFRMYYANPKAAISKMIMKDENNAYIDSDWLYSIHFTKESFTYVSEADGYAHIYLYGNTGVLQKQVTSGHWDVTDLLGIDPITNTIYYESAEESPLKRAVYKIDAKGKKTKLSAQAGFNKASFSSNFNYFINNYSNSNTPNRISICDNNGKELLVMEDNKALQTLLSQNKPASKEFMTIPSAGGKELNAWMIKPSNFKASQKYPVVMLQYSGPNSQEVLDEYDLGWEQYLASQGFIVVCVDGRGTGARGEAFRKCTYLKLGILESDDQIEAARYLGKQPFVDKNRIAIWGWSFGGTVSLLSMSRGNGVFKAGIAIAAVSDWKLYDTVYTERYMRTPNENFDGYKSASPITYAGDLEGKLLLVHGTSDDNVHYQNALYYSAALTEAGKLFDTQLYTNKEHSLLGYKTRLHLYNKCSQFLKDNL